MQKNKKNNIVIVIAILWISMNLWYAYPVKWSSLRTDVFMELVFYTNWIVLLIAGWWASNRYLFLYSTAAILLVLLSWFVAPIMTFHRIYPGLDEYVSGIIKYSQNYNWLEMIRDLVLGVIVIAIGGGFRVMFIYFTKRG